MGNFLKALAKVGLVELEGSEAAAAADSGEEMSQEEIQRILAETRGSEDTKGNSPADPPTAREAPALKTQVAPTSEIEEGRALTAIYTEVGISESPFPAEKLLKLLDGLRAMDESTRKQAIIAMDQADEAWTIEDAILDATRKVDALRSAQNALKQSLQSTETQATSELEAQDTYQQQATEMLRAQIAELEKKLQSEVETVANEKAAIKSRVEANRAAAQREEARLETEIQRLAEIGRIFQTEGS